MNLLDAQPVDARRFLRWLVVAAVVGLCAVAGVNLRAEAVLGSSITTPLVQHPLGGGATEYDQKTRLLTSRQRIDVALLGNSRVQRFDPQQVEEATGLETFNAGIVGAQITDSRAIVDWLADRFTPMPHLIFVLPVESFEPQRPPTIDLPRTEPPTLRERARARADRTTRLLQLETLRIALRILRDEEPAPNPTPATAPSSRATPVVPPGSSALPAPLGALPSGPNRSAITSPVLRAPGMESGWNLSQAPQPRTADRTFREDGFVTTGPFFGASMFGAPGQLKRFVDGQYRSFYDQVQQRGGPDHVEPSSLRELERLISAANRAGDTPTIVLPPMASKLARELRPYGRDTYVATVRSELEQLRSRHRFLLIDWSDARTFGVTGEAMYDGVHARPQLTGLMVKQLLQLDPVLRDAAR